MNGCYFVTSGGVMKQRLDTRKKAGKYTYFHQLNNSQLLVVFSSAISEALHQVYR
jgi:hypothetical protein